MAKTKKAKIKLEKIPHERVKSKESYKYGEEPKVKEKNKYEDIEEREEELEE